MKKDITKTLHSCLLAIVSIIFLHLVQPAQAQLAKCKGKFLGNIMPSNWQGEVIRSDFGAYWNQVSPENAGKWGVAENNRNNFSWGDLDKMYNYCLTNNIPFKQHVFVWGSQQPSWIGGLSAQVQRDELEDWYAQFAKRYPKTAMIDVVNESIRNHAPEVQFKNAIGGLNNGATIPYLANHPTISQYGYGTGWDYIIYSFAKARDYFPNAELILNDYGIINDPSAIAEHLAIVNILKKRGLIDAVGFQGHNFNVDNMSATQMKNNLDLLAAAGLPIYVTELDITGNTEQQQKDRYATLFPVMWEHPKVKGITLWGYVEGQTWKDGTGILNSNGTERAAMKWLKEYMASRPDICNTGAPEVELTKPTSANTFETNTEIKLEASALDANGSITKVEFYANGNLLGTSNTSPYAYTWIPNQKGSYEITAKAYDNENNTTISEGISITINEPQTPYNNQPALIPGMVEFEEYDLGGNNSAYYDDSQGSEVSPIVNFRQNEDVDIEACTDENGGYNIGYATKGEWLEYTVDVMNTGNYSFTFRYAVNGDNRTFHLEIDGKNITGAITLDNTKGWQTWADHTINGIELVEGVQVIRVVFDTDYMNLNYMNIIPEFITSIEDIKNKISVYPNPFRLTTSVIVPNNSAYEIWSITGNLVEQGIITNQAFIGLNLESGSFVLKIISDLETTTTVITKL